MKEKQNYALDDEFDDLDEDMTVDQFIELSEIQTKKSDRPVELVREYGPGLFLYHSYDPSKFYDKTISVYLVDKNDNTVERMKFHEFIQETRMKDYVEIYLNIEAMDSFSETFWKNPEYLYHGTHEDNKDSILKKGLLPSYESRGLTNSNIGDAVFTNTNIEVASEYGDVVFKIDTIKMKEYGYMPEVSMEPDVLEDQYYSALYNLFEMEYEYEDSGTGMDPNTVIIYNKIPTKYLKIVS